MELGELTADAAEMEAGGTLNLSIQVTNAGASPVTETLQLYLRDLVASVSRPVKELRGYQRVTLAPGESRVVSFRISDADLAFPGMDFHPVVEPGEFDAMVGCNSAELRKFRFKRLG